MIKNHLMRLFGGGWKERENTFPLYLVHEIYCRFLYCTESKIEKITEISFI